MEEKNTENRFPTVGDGSGLTHSDKLYKEEVQLGETISPYAWTAWTFPWIAQPGSHTLCVRATDSQGNGQSLDQQWNLGGYGNNMIQRVEVRVE